jgi:hypothetical protein
LIFVTASIRRIHDERSGKWHRKDQFLTAYLSAKQSERSTLLWRTTAGMQLELAEEYLSPTSVAVS